MSISLRNNPSHVAVGRIINTHGIGGMLKVAPLMDEPELLLSYEQMWVEDHARNMNKLIIERSSVHKNVVLVKFLDIDDIDSASVYKNQLLFVPRLELPELPEGKYYIFELLDMAVYKDDGQFLGTLTDVLDTGAKSVYVITGETDEILIPNIPEVVRQVSLTEHKMIVHLLPGMGE